jgi:hypothetical protein
LKVQEESDSGEGPSQTQRRRRGPPSDDSEEEEEEEEQQENGDGIDATHEATEQLVKKFVRYALACEYQRIPIRRAAVTEKGRFQNISQFVWLG